MAGRPHKDHYLGSRTRRWVALPVFLLAVLLGPPGAPAQRKDWRVYLDPSDPAMWEHYEAYRRVRNTCPATGSALARRRADVVQRLRSADPERLGRFLARSYQNAIAEGDRVAGSILTDLALLGPEIALPVFEQELRTEEDRPPFHREMLLAAIQEVRSRRALPLIRDIYEESVLAGDEGPLRHPFEPPLRALAVAAAVANSFGTLSSETLYDPVERTKRMGDWVWVARPADATDEDRERVVQWIREIAHKDPLLEVREAASKRLELLDEHGASRAVP